MFILGRNSPVHPGPNHPNSTARTVHNTRSVKIRFPLSHEFYICSGNSNYRSNVLATLSPLNNDSGHCLSGSRRRISFDLLFQLSWSTKCLGWEPEYRLGCSGFISHQEHQGFRSQYRLGSGDRTSGHQGLSFVRRTDGQRGQIPGRWAGLWRGGWGDNSAKVDRLHYICLKDVDINHKFQLSKAFNFPTWCRRPLYFILWRFNLKETIWP